ncbi:LOW QUALITY PROTEIN: hypothetical protein V2J09_023248 [Rumex salicifolius]
MEEEDVRVAQEVASSVSKEGVERPMLEVIKQDLPDGLGIWMLPKYALTRQRRELTKELSQPRGKRRVRRQIIFRRWRERLRGARIKNASKITVVWTPVGSSKLPAKKTNQPQSGPEGFTFSANEDHREKPKSTKGVGLSESGVSTVVDRPKPNNDSSAKKKSKLKEGIGPSPMTISIQSDGPNKRPRDRKDLEEHYGSGFVTSSAQTLKQLHTLFASNPGDRETLDPSTIVGSKFREVTGTVAPHAGPTENYEVDGPLYKAPPSQRKECTYDMLGAGTEGFRGVVRYLLKNNKINISGSTTLRVRNKLNFSKWVRVDVVGRSDGIWFLWNDSEVDQRIINTNPNFIQACIHMGGDRCTWWRFMDLQRLKEGFWKELEDCVKDISDPLFIGGDYNCIVSLDERQGGSPVLSEDSTIRRLNLIDLGFCGSRFTWKRGNSVGSRIEKRLDRVLTNLHGRLAWEEAIVKHLPSLSSDHNPLLLKLKGDGGGSRFRPPFRFEAAWIEHPQFLSSHIGTLVWIRVWLLRRDLLTWNRKVFGNIHLRKVEIVVRLGAIKRYLETEVNPKLLDQERAAQDEFANISTQEEILWYQKSRRRRSNIKALWNIDDSWIVDKNQLEAFAVDYFKQLYFLPESDATNVRLLRGGFPVLEDSHKQALGKEVSDGEI